MKTPAAVTRLLKFIEARHAVYMNRSAGKPKPWTDDPILLDYKFTNVYRELDKTTVWIAENWRTPHADDEDMWFAMAVARLMNRPSSMGMLGYPVPWKPARFIKLVHDLKAQRQPAFGAAYMISTHGMREDKAEFIANRILTPLWQARKKLRPRAGDSLEEFYNRLSEHFGMGRFIAAQVIADVKYAPVLAGADDWWTWAVSGPGSRRGMNRVTGRHVHTGWPDAAWKYELDVLRMRYVEPFIESIKYQRLHAQDLQNCLCEFDKYERIRLQEGRMKCKYNGRN